MRTNTLKAKLRAGKRAIGFSVMGNWPELIEMMAYCGVDCVMLDGEHGILSLPDIANLVRAAENVGITPIARVGRNAADLILSYLDAGVQGIIVPKVESKEEAERAVRAVKYYPLGERGCGYGHMREWGITQSFAEYIAEANRETMVILQCESKKGLDNLEEIVRVEGVDMIQTGPLCMSQSLGIPGQVDHPLSLAVYQRIKEITLGAGKWLTTVATTGEEADRLFAEGVQFVNCGLHSVIIPALKQYVAHAKAGE